MGEDEDFIFYKYKGKNVCGMLGKKYITSMKSQKDEQMSSGYDRIDKNYNSFEDAMLVLQLGKKVKIDEISKLEELDN